MIASGAVSAGPDKDCLLTGTVVRGAPGNSDAVSVKIHSVDKYDDEANCRVRSGQKMEFKLPSDARLQQAPEGSEVKYRYREDGEGSVGTELLSVGA